MPDRVHQFIVAACVPRDEDHRSGTLDKADTILAEDPGIAGANIHTAAILGEVDAVRRFIASNPADATVKGGPYKWDALTHLCFSKHVRLSSERSWGLVRAAEALLDAGANPNSGFFSPVHQPQPGFESVLYGAAGVAHHVGLTRLLLERGADPNDGEVAYHAPEDTVNDVLKLLVQTGRLNTDSLNTMLLRKADWHDYQGLKWLLEHGADPNRITHWGFSALHQALRRDNALQNIEIMLDHGADPRLENRTDGKSAAAIAARRGRSDALELFERRGLPVSFRGLERVIAACARGDCETIRAIQENEPRLVDELKAQGGKLLAEFAGNGNTEGVRRLLDLGIPVGALDQDGDGYFDVAKGSTALHAAAWRARHDTVRLLLERGALVSAQDSKGRTPLALAVRACVDSYWQARRSPESVQALLAAGASVDGVKFPSGYEAIDELLQAHGAR